MANLTMKTKRSGRQPANNFYVHSNPPRVLPSTSTQIKQLIRKGDLEKLEQVVLDGHGRKLVGEYTSDYKTRTFLKKIPTLMTKISLLHDAVNSGRLEELKSLLDEETSDERKKLVRAKDDFGVGLLHKAIYYDIKDIYKYLIEKFPHIVHIKDAEGRTALHYTPMCKEPEVVQKMLIGAGIDASSLDLKQHSAKYYKSHPRELELPNLLKSVRSNKNDSQNDGLNFKKSNIRIWIHQRNIASLQQVMWEGHGSKLLVEHSNNPKIRKFLEAVPHIMGLVKSIHTDVVNDDLENLKHHADARVPPIVLSSKDQNGLTSLHKAAGLGRLDIAKFIIAEYPQAVNLVDLEGRTSLHYSSLLKDEGKMTHLLLESGADESALDNKQKTAAYYKSRNSEIDNKLLTVIPDCPRNAKESFISTFDWGLLAITTPLETNRTILDNPNENKYDEETGPTPRVINKRDIKDDENENVDLSETTQQPNEQKIDDNENVDVPETKSEADIRNDAEYEQPAVTEDVTDSRLETTRPNSEEAKEETTELLVEAVEADEQRSNSVLNEAENSEQINELQEDNTREFDDENDEAEPEEVPVSDDLLETEKDNETEEVTETSKSAKTSPADVEFPQTAEVEPEEVIEGVVNGENEIEILNEQGQDSHDTNDSNEDTEISAIIESGNMEQLAALVLNGQGERLLGKSSNNPELQSFLDNVQIYMSKIGRIHAAAKEGSLRDLQAALDRRKFAVAKDKSSPDGASPLHVAVVFGNTSIVRYLAGRFPETTQVTDNNGRSPLHYAAVLPDNGHYYNLLIHLGADPKCQDEFGHAPEYYRKHQDILSHKSLLKNFGAEESVAEEILSDKGNIVPATGNNVDMPFFATEEGRYLASSLGDPLIKGLTEVANKRPEDPIAYLATYLYNFANNKQKTSRGRNQDGNDEIGNNNVPASIEVVTVEPDDVKNEEYSAFNYTSRDEHGQSMLHFAAARAHGRNAIFQLLIETEINVSYRDELYRTARDISIQANLPENTAGIDRFVMNIATKGDTDKLVELLLDGYDHITDIVDENDVAIVETVARNDQPATVIFLQSILAFEEKRERVHHAIRLGSINDVTTLLADENDNGSGKLLSIGKNSYGRCSLHIAVLCQQEEIIDYLANTFPDTLRLGDNLERTALHYAMGIEKMESISKVLIKAGSKRIVKDLKGRQPTYYFLNKSDILRLQEEEETF